MLVKLATLHRALENDRLVPFFQPLVELRTGRLVGFEVLTRLQHPRLGPILPENLIALAERRGLMTLLMHQVFRKAFSTVADMPVPPRLAVNVSASQLCDLSLPGQILRLADEAGFPLSKLTVEITETALLSNPQRATTILEALKAMGCCLSLDDFGTGYSSLSHLQALPFDEIKIDRSFIAAVTDARESRKIVTAIIGLGHSLGLSTVAEGIETEGQREMMLRLGCDLGQGWLYGRPVPANELVSIIAAAPHASSKLVSINNADESAAFGLEAHPVQRLAQLRAIYDGSPVGLAFLDTRLRYVSINQKLADFNGSSVESHLGREVREMIGEAFGKYEPYLRRALQGEAIKGVEVRRPGLNRGDPERITLASYQPALDEADEVVGISISIADITDERRGNEAPPERSRPRNELRMPVKSITRNPASSVA